MPKRQKKGEGSTMKVLEIVAFLMLLTLVVSCRDEGRQKIPTINDARLYDFLDLEKEAKQARVENVGKKDLVSITGSELFTGSDFYITFESQSEICSPLSSATQSVNDGLIRRPRPVSPLRHHWLREWSLFEYSASNTSTARVVLSQNRLRPENYLAMGHYMCMEGDLAAKSIENAEAGAFVESPELAGRPPQLPTEGTFIYTGYIMAMYTYFYGSLWEEKLSSIPGSPFVEGVEETGELSGPLSLQVDFTNRTVEACYGCVENVELTSILVDLEGNQELFYTPASFHSGPFSPLRIQQDGTFHGTNSNTPRLDHPLLLPDINDLGVEVSNSIWGGKFSNISADDGTGAPRLVAGTFRTDYVLADGSRNTGFGSFFATKVSTTKQTVNSRN
jgi:hypothetical protein